MDDNETQEVVTEEVAAEVEETTEETEAVTEEKTEAKPTETLEQREARLARQLEQTRKKLGKTEEKPAPKAKTDGLDDTTLDYLDLKGVSESEDIAVIEKIMEKTGMSAREALKDDYVVAKLAANKATREVQAATPSSTKRGSGNTADAVSRALAKFEKDGVMPDDFDLRSKVVDAIEAKSSGNAPSWRS